MKKIETTTITISRESLEKLVELKYKLHFKSYDDMLKALFEAMTIAKDGKLELEIKRSKDVTTVPKMS